MSDPYADPHGDPDPYRIHHSLQARVAAWLLALNYSPDQFTVGEVLNNAYPLTGCRFCGSKTTNMLAVAVTIYPDPDLTTYRRGGINLCVDIDACEYRLAVRGETTP